MHDVSWFSGELSGVFGNWYLSIRTELSLPDFCPILALSLNGIQVAVHVLKMGNDTELKNQASQILFDTLRLIKINLRFLQKRAEMSGLAAYVDFSTPKGMNLFNLFRLEFLNSSTRLNLALSFSDSSTFSSSSRLFCHRRIFPSNDLVVPTMIQMCKSSIRAIRMKERNGFSSYKYAL